MPTMVTSPASPVCTGTAVATDVDDPPAVGLLVGCSLAGGRGTAKASWMGTMTWEGGGMGFSP